MPKMSLEVTKMIARGVEAATLPLTDVVGRQTNKARSLTAWLRQVRAVVGLPDKPTGVGADNTRAGLTSTHPGTRTQLKLTGLLSLRSPGKSRHGADNERSPIRQADSSYRRADGRNVDPFSRTAF